MTAERWGYKDPHEGGIGPHRGVTLTFDGRVVSYDSDHTMHDSQAKRMVELLNANNVVPLSAVREAVADTLHTVDDKANGWSKAAREAVHEAMGLLQRRLGEVEPGAKPGGTETDAT